MGGALASRSNKSVKAGTLALARVGSLSRLRGSRSMLTQLSFSIISAADTFSFLLWLLMTDMSARKAGSVSQELSRSLKCGIFESLDWNGEKTEVVGEQESQYNSSGGRGIWLGYNHE